MADNGWSESTCRPGICWWGVPGQGTHYWTARFGQYWVGGGVYQRYAASGWECGALGPPVKPYQWLSEFASYGQWFEGGAIFYSGGQWRMVLGDYGQTAGRLTAEPEPVAPDDAQVPPDAPTDEPAPRPPLPDDAESET